MTGESATSTYDPATISAEFKIDRRDETVFRGEMAAVGDAAWQDYWERETRCAPLRSEHHADGQRRRMRRYAEPAAAPAAMTVNGSACPHAAAAARAMVIHRAARRRLDAIGPHGRALLHCTPIFSPRRNRRRPARIALVNAFEPAHPAMSPPARQCGNAAASHRLADTIARSLARPPPRRHYAAARSALPRDEIAHISDGDARRSIVDEMHIR